jgi:hypothetical protein
MSPQDGLHLIYLLSAVTTVLIIWYFWSRFGPKVGKQERELRTFWSAARRRDENRRAEYEEWVAARTFPDPVTRYYETGDEFHWEWARLKDHYALDHTPIEVEDGLLMVTYSVRPDDHRPTRI